MKNWGAIGIGVALTLAAMKIGAGISNQDVAQQPEDARRFATALHQTLTPLPALTPTPLHVRQLLPAGEEVLDLLFLPSYHGASINTSHAKVLMRLLDSREAATLIVAGEDATASTGGRTFLIAFGAILARENGEYVTKYLEVEWGERDSHVEYALFNDGSIAFHFFNLGRDAGHDLQDQRTVTVSPCRAELGALVMQGMGQLTREVRASHCF
jgi:hypothetical protein